MQYSLSGLAIKGGNVGKADKDAAHWLKKLNLMAYNKVSGDRYPADSDAAKRVGK